MALKDSILGKYEEAVTDPHSDEAESVLNMLTPLDNISIILTIVRSNKFIATSALQNALI